jgi:glycosyltransferase involved in cell wall biosynthesis
VDGRAALSRGVPRVATVHGFTANGWKNRVYEWMQRRTYRSFSGVVAVSRGQLPLLLEAGTAEDRVRVIPNAWTEECALLGRNEARAELGLEDDAFVVGWVGRFGREKGPDVLLDAVPYLDAGAVVSMIGDGSMSAALREQAARVGCAERLRWHGSRDRAGRLFRAFDVLVLSSRTEGTPMVLFEAMAAEVPIVATAVGGVPDVVGVGEAVLVPSEDPVALARAIAEVRRDQVNARVRAAAALRRLHSAYALTPWLESYEAIYRAVRVQHERTTA